MFTKVRNLKPLFSSNHDSAHTPLFCGILSHSTLSCRSKECKQTSEWWHVSFKWSGGKPILQLHRWAHIYRVRSVRACVCQLAGWGLGVGSKTTDKFTSVHRFIDPAGCVLGFRLNNNEISAPTGLSSTDIWKAESRMKAGQEQKASRRRGRWEQTTWEMTQSKQ